MATNSHPSIEPEASVTAPLPEVVRLLPEPVVAIVCTLFVSLSIGDSEVKHAIGDLYNKNCPIPTR
jgi:hypothetical protein